MSVFSQQAFDQHETVTFHTDKKSGLRAIIAVHDSSLGPAVGGCRMFPYASDTEALYDVLRLSRGMTYKSALAGLPFGGGKAVIIGNPHTEKNPELLEAMGDFVNSLHGRYIVAEDSGIGVSDIRIMSGRTQWVSGLADNEHNGDPSPSTAYGVYLGIRSAIRHRLATTDLSGLSVAIQGLGNVGFHLARLLRAEGSKVYGADINAKNVERAVKVLGVIPVDTGDILQMEVDVIAPCAMGAVLNSKSIPNIRSGIVCGAANNQLAEVEDGFSLLDRGILYCPDFLVNAGGIIDVHHQQIGLPDSSRDTHILQIEPALLEVLSRAESEQTSTHLVAEKMAKDKLASFSKEPAPITMTSRQPVAQAVAGCFAMTNIRQ